MLAILERMLNTHSGVVFSEASIQHSIRLMQAQMNHTPADWTAPVDKTQPLK